LKGKLNLEIRNKFYQTIKKTIDTSKQTDYYFNLELNPKYTFLNIETASKATIKLNEEIFKGSIENKIVTKTIHKLKIEGEFYQTIEKEIDTSKKDSYNFKVNLKPKYTSINIDAGYSAIIHLNDEVFYDKINNKIVSKGIHKLKITKKWYETINEEIDTRVKTDYKYDLKRIK